METDFDDTRVLLALSSAAAYVAATRRNDNGNADLALLKYASPAASYSSGTGIPRPRSTRAQAMGIAPAGDVYVAGMYRRVELAWRCGATRRKVH